jgi:hypothetical protein
MMAWLTNATLSLPVRQVLPEVMRGLIFFSNYVIQIKMLILDGSLNYKYLKINC